MTYPNQIFSAFAFLGFVLCAIPLPWHFEAWNTGTCLFMIWTGLSCLNLGINSIIWTGNAINWSPVWCDISTKFIIGASVGIPAATVCINRRLYLIATVKTVTVSKAEKLRGVYIDLAIGLGLPILEMVLHYIPQGHRFNIFEDVGCWPHTHNNWVAYLVVYSPPVVLGLVGTYYSIRSFIAFNKSRTQFNALLSSHSNLTTSRYFRLMYMSASEILCVVPFSAYVLYANATGLPLRPWISWENVHWRFSRVDCIPAMIWRAQPFSAMGFDFTRWLCVVCAIIIFIFLGLAEEAKKRYRSAVTSITKRVGITTGTFTSTNSGGFFASVGGGGKSTTGATGKIRPALPVFVHKEMLSHRESVMSISDMSIADAGGLLGEKGDDDEKASEFSPTLSYGGITLSDAGNTLADNSESPAFLAPPSSGTSSTSTPSLTRENSQSNLEISSLRNDSLIRAPEKAHTSDVV